VSAIEASSDIHLVTLQQSGRVAYHHFDPGTDTWTVEDEEVEVAREETDFEERAQEGTESIGLVRRGDGDMVVAVGYRESSGNQRIATFSRDGSTWSQRADAEAVASQNVVVCPAPHSSDDRTIFAYLDTAANQLSHNTLTSANAIGTPGDTDTTVDTATQVIGQGVYLSTDAFIFPYIDASDKVSLYELSIAATPSETQYTDRSANTVYGNGRTAVPYTAFCLCVESDDTVHLLYADASTQDLYHQPDATNATPPSETEEVDAATVNRISCRVVNTDGNIYVAYDDAGTLKFLDISLGAGATLKTSSESLPIGLTESNDTIALVSATESVPIGLAEDRLIASTVSSAGDTLPIGLTEAVLIEVTDASSESLPVGLTEVPATTVLIAASDSFTAGLSEDRIIASTVSSVGDTLPLGLVEVVNALSVTVASAESIPLGLTEDVNEALALLSVAESIPVGLTDSIQSLVNILASAESISLGMTDVVDTLVVSIARAEVVPIGLDEDLVSLIASFSREESVSIGLTDVLNTLLVSLDRADTISIGMGEPIEVLLLEFSSSESLSLGMIDALNELVVSLSRADTLPIGMGEPFETFLKEMFGSDTVPIGLSEDLNTLVVSLSRAESLPIGLAEPLEALLLSLTASESVSVGMAEIVNTLTVSLSRADTIPIGMGEPIESFLREISGSDVTPVGLIEAVNSLIVSLNRSTSFSVQITPLTEVLETVFVLTSEAFPIGTLTARDILVSISREETLPIQVIAALNELRVSIATSESLPVGFIDALNALTLSFSSTESLKIGLVELAAILETAFVASGESLPLTIDTVSTFLKSLNRSDDLPVGMTSSLQTLTVTLQIAESLPLTILDASVIANTLATVSEELGIALTVASDVFVLLATSENLPVGISELFVDMTVNVGASETVPLQILDTLNQLFVTLAVSNALGISFQEASDITRLLSDIAEQFSIGLIELTDLVIDEADAAIIKTASESIPLTIEDVTNTLQVLVSISEVLAIPLIEASGLLVLLQPIADSLGIAVTTLVSVMAQFQATEAVSILLSSDALIASVLTVSDTLPVQTIEQLQALEVTLAFAEDLHLGWAEAPKLEGVLRTASEILGVGITELGQAGISSLVITGADTIQIQLIDGTGNVIVTKILEKVRAGMGIRRDKEIRPRSFRIRPGRVW
jgi:hypothetical protein